MSTGRVVYLMVPSPNDLSIRPRQINYYNQLVFVNSASQFGVSELNQLGVYEPSQFGVL